MTELKAELIAAEKIVVIFDADLGPIPTANRTAFNNTLPLGSRPLLSWWWVETSGDIVESIRVVKDTLSCTDNMEFLGRSTHKKNPQAPPSQSYYPPLLLNGYKSRIPGKEYKNSR
jgi:hypothetical protein